MLVGLEPGVGIQSTLPQPVPTSPRSDLPPSSSSLPSNASPCFHSTLLASSPTTYTGLPWHAVRGWIWPHWGASLADSRCGVNMLYSMLVTPKWQRKGSELACVPVRIVLPKTLWSTPTHLLTLFDSLDTFRNK